MMRIAITGGAGFLGQEIVRQSYDYSSRIVIYSRDEGKQQSMALDKPEYPDNIMRYVLGDICDTDRLTQAIRGCDMLIHAAAMKMIDRCDQRNIEQSLHTNVTGTLSVAKACHAACIKKALFVSSDKGCQPIAVYGAEKFIGEKIFASWNNFSDCQYASVRYGNVHSSSKSVFNIWKDRADYQLPLLLTHKDMTRFFWDVKDAAKFCIDRLEDMERGCLYIPKMKGYRMWDEANKISPEITVTGLRTLEKIHEDLISEHEAYTCYDRGDYWVIYPFDHEWTGKLRTRGNEVPEGFKVRSNDNL